jgi:hypothetical protein
MAAYPGFPAASDTVGDPLRSGCRQPFEYKNVHSELVIYFLNVRPGYC